MPVANEHLNFLLIVQRFDKSESELVSGGVNGDLVTSSITAFLLDISYLMSS